jgi:cystathionine beta-lyase/cystathionine gamma-synthase
MAIDLFLAGFLRGAVILGAGGVAMPLLGRASAATRRLVLALALGGALVVPVVAPLVPAWHPAAPGPVAYGRDVMEPLNRRMESPVIAPRAVGLAAAPPAARPLSLGTALVGLWGVGAIVLALRLASSLVRAEGMRRRARAATGWAAARERLGTPVDVRETDELEGPAVAGLFASAVLVPAASGEWSEERKEAVLLHELAHVRRRDCLVHAVGELARAVHWLNPLAWVLLARLRDEREHAADDAALTAGATPSTYASHLLAVAVPDAPVGALAMAERSILGARIEAVVAVGRRRLAPSRVEASAWVLLGGSLVGAVACTSPRTDLASSSSASSVEPAAIDGPRDARLQTIADEELDRMLTSAHLAVGAIVIVEPRTGAVLANAGRIRGQHADVASTRRYVTGSTFKAITLAGALDDGVVKIDERFDCENGERHYGAKILHDARPAGVLSVPDMMASSSNVGFSKIFDRLGEGRMGSWIKAFHLDGIPDRAPGGSLEGGILAIGMAGTTTALQMAAVYATFANEGVSVAPSAPGAPSAAGTRILKAETARAVTEVLEHVVTSDRGTGAAARVAGVRVAGKTGTSDGTLPDGTEGHYASFIGFAPVEAPRFVIVVGAETPQGSGTGATVAAPAFARVLQRALALLPGLLTARPVSGYESGTVMKQSPTSSSFAAALREVLPRLLGQPGALPDDWQVQATTYDLPRFHSAATFAARLRAAVDQILTEDVRDPARLRALLVECGLPYDYARLGQPLSTLYEIYLQALSGAAEVLSFASQTKPYLAVLEARRGPSRLYAAGTLPLSAARQARLRQEGVEIHENWRGPLPEAPPGTLTLYVSGEPFSAELMSVRADGLCYPVAEGGVLLIKDPAVIDPDGVRLIRKRTAAALLAASAQAELERLVGLPVAPPPAGDQAAACDRLLRGLFPEVTGTLYFCTGLAAEAAVFSAVAEELGPVTFFYAQNGYGGTGQLIADILPRDGLIRPVPLPVIEQDAAGRTVTIIDRITRALPGLGGAPACLFLEMPTNPELQVHDFPALMAALRAYRAEHGVVIPVLVDTTLAPLYPLFSQDFTRDWPFVCVKSGSKYFTRGKATLGVAFCAEQPLARAILERARAFGRDTDTFARPSQLAAAVEGLSELRPRMAKIAARTRQLAAGIEAALRARGHEITLYHVTDEALAAGLATGLLSFYLPPAPTTAPDLVDEFVDYLLAHAPDLVKNRVSYGQFAGENRPDHVYVINPQESTQGSLPEATKAAQKRDNVQICRVSVSENADVVPLLRVMESFFDLKYGPPTR